MVRGRSNGLKAGGRAVSSTLAALVAVLIIVAGAVLSLVMLAYFTSVAVQGADVERLAQKSRETVKLAIGYEEVKDEEGVKYLTKMQLKNAWSGTTEITYAVVLDRQGRVMYEREFNPPLTLYASEVKFMKPSELVPELAPYDGDWRRMRDEVGLIILHTRLGNRFTSFYETAGAPTAVETETAESITTIWVETTHVTVTIPTYTTVTVYITKTTTSGVTTVWTTVWVLVDEPTTTWTVEKTVTDCQANTVTVTETVSQDSTTWVTDTRTVTGTTTTWVTPTSWTTATITITPTTTTWTTVTEYTVSTQYTTVTTTSFWATTYLVTTEILKYVTQTYWGYRVGHAVGDNGARSNGNAYLSAPTITPICLASDRRQPPPQAPNSYVDAPPEQRMLSGASLILLGSVAVFALPDRLYRLARRNAWKIAAALVMVALASVYIMPGGESVVSLSDMTITTTYTDTFYTPRTTTTTVCCVLVTVPSTITYTDYKGYLITTYAGTTTTVPQVTKYVTKTTHVTGGYECSGETQDVTVTTTKYVGNVITSTTTTTITVGATVTSTAPAVTSTATTTATGTSTLTSTRTSYTWAATSTTTVTRTCKIVTNRIERWVVTCTVTATLVTCSGGVGLCTIPSPATWDCVNPSSPDLEIVVYTEGYCYG